MPSNSYSIEGTISVGGYLQVGMTVTIQNTTKGLSGTCTTDALGRYLYDDIQDSHVQAEAGDSIRVCTVSSGSSSVTFTAGTAEEKVVNLEYILHPHAPPPYSVEGTVTYHGVAQNNLTVTIRNLTTGTSGVCTTDSSGHYFYDDIRDGVIVSTPGDLINVGTPDGATETFTAVSSEEKVIDFLDILMRGGLWKVVITPASGGAASTFLSYDGALGACWFSPQVAGMTSFDVVLNNDGGTYNSMFEVGDQVEIWMDSDLGVSGSSKWVKGIIDTVEYIRNAQNENRIKLTGFDYLSKFKTIVVNEIYRGPRSYEDIITNPVDGLLALYAPEISGSGVQATDRSISVDETMKFAHIFLYDALEKIRESIGDWVFSISPTGILNLLPRGTTDPNKELVVFDNTGFTYDKTNMANKIIVIGSTDLMRLNKNMWVGTASHNNSDAPLAYNDEYDTGWDSGIPQDVGQWYKLDLGGTIVVDEMFLNNSRYFPDNFPRNFKVEASSDDVSYDEITTISSNVSPDVIISFRKNYYRYIKISILGTNANNWIIGELNVYTRYPIMAQYEDATSIADHGLTWGQPIWDGSLVNKSQVVSRAIAEVTARKEPEVSGSISIDYYFLIHENELLTCTIPGTPISQQFVVQKVSFSEAQQGTWRETIELRSA